MLRRIGFGLLWFFVLYVGACAFLGAIAGAGAGAGDPAHAFEAGKNAGASAVKPLVPYVFLGSIVISVVGSVVGVLPGTRKKGVQK